MEKKLNGAKDRILYLVKKEGISKRSFYKKTGISNGTLDQKTGLSEENMVKYLSTYPEINPTWLLTGRGSMLLEGEKKTEALPAELSDAKKIPLVDAYAVGGFGSVDFKLEQQDVKEYYIIPKFKDRQIDFMIEISGSSMYPKYNSGDVIACRVILERAFIQWNHTHVIATREQGILVKRLRESEMEGSLLAVSDNQNYPPFHIPEREITGLALVVGVIRLE